MTGYFTLLRTHRHVRGLWFAQLASQIGDQVGLIALFQLCSGLGGDVSALGFVLVVQQMPTVVLGSVAGYVADRFDRRTVMIVADVARSVIALAFLFVDQARELGWLYGVALVLYSISPFFEPSRQALLQTIVPDEDIVAAIALSGATYGIASGLGCLAGGLVIEWASERSAFVLESAMFLASALLVLRLGALPVLSASARADRSTVTTGTLRSFLAGNRQAMAALLVKLLGAGLTGGGMWVIVVVYGQQTFPIGNGGAVSVGILNGAMFLGGLVGPSLVTRLFRHETTAKGSGVMRGISLFFALRAALLVALAWSPNLVVASLAAMGLVVAAYGSVLSSTILLQRLSPDHVRGRLFALDLAIWTLGVVVSAQASGFVMSHWQVSPQHVALGLGAMMFAITGVWLVVATRWERWGTTRS